VIDLGPEGGSWVVACGGGTAREDRAVKGSSYGEFLPQGVAGGRLSHRLDE